MARRLIGRVISAVLATTMLAGLSACGHTGNEAGHDATTAEVGQTDAAVEKDMTLSGLPTEPGYSWDIAQYPGGGTVPVQMTAEGPWTIEAGGDWPISTTEVVDPAGVPGIDAFADYDHVVKTVIGGEDWYYPRRVADGWLLQLGSITGAGESATAEPYEDPVRFWPMDFEVGGTYVVLEGESFRVDATVVGQNTAHVPAGDIEDAYLMRFDYTPITPEGIEATHYYILAPNVGFVALFSVAAGDETVGFTELDSLQVLATLPAKR